MVGLTGARAGEENFGRMFVMVPSLLQPALRALNELVFPATCLHCGATGQDYPLCASCLGNVRRAAAEPACALCGALIVLDGAGCQRCENKGLAHIEGVVRMTVYAGPVRTLVLRAKFSKEWPLLEYLSGMAREEPGLREMLAGIDVLQPVPLHSRRLWGRGFNQAEVIARTLKTEQPVVQALRRVRHTEAQSKQKSATARQRNVKDAFAVRQPERIAGRRVLLIDDVLTTGSTLIEAARALKKGGAKSVSAFALATADPRGGMDE